MEKNRHTVESIVAMLREAEVLMAKGQSLVGVLRQLGISDATYYKWRKEYGGLQVDQAKRYKELEQDNHQLQKLFIQVRLPMLDRITNLTLVYKLRVGSTPHLRITPMNRGTHKPRSHAKGAVHSAA